MKQTSWLPAATLPFAVIPSRRRRLSPAVLLSRRRRAGRKRDRLPARPARRVSRRRKNLRRFACSQPVGERSSRETRQRTRKHRSLLLPLRVLSRSLTSFGVFRGHSFPRLGREKSPAALAASRPPRTCASFFHGEGRRRWRGSFSAKSAALSRMMRMPPPNDDRSQDRRPRSP